MNYQQSIAAFYIVLYFIVVVFSLNVTKAAVDELTILILFSLGAVFYFLYRGGIYKKELLNNNNKLNTIIEEADSGIGLLNLQGDFLEVNSVYCSLLGYTKKELQSLNCIDLTEKSFQDAAKKVLEETRQNGSISKFKKDCIAKNGDIVHLEMSLKLMPDQSSFICVINSLDEKIALEEAFKKYEYIFNFTSVAFTIVDDQRKIVDVNPKCLKLFGYETKEEMVGQNAEILHIDQIHYKEYGKLIFSKAMKHETVRVEYQLKRKNGTSFWCEISGSPLDDDARFTNGGVLWAAIDITDKVEAQNLIIQKNKELEELNQNLNDEVQKQIADIREKDSILIQKSKMAAMGEMMDAVAHQWKQPLGVVKLSASELELMYQEDKVSTKYIDELSGRIIKQVDHMNDTIDEFREFFRPNNAYQNVSLKEMIDSSLTLMKDDLIKHMIVTRFIGDDTLKVKIIPNEFKHIIINLVNNAKDEFVNKNIKKERLIIFEGVKSDNFVILKIKDNAGGIPKDIIKDIFKANVTTKGEKEGTGIGLYMTKNIIEKIGGSIEASNSKEGAEFLIRIPV